MKDIDEKFLFVAVRSSQAFREERNANELVLADEESNSDRKGTSRFNSVLQAR
jgi:hypothetical protein